MVIGYLKSLKDDKYDGLEIDFLKDVSVNYTWISDTFVVTIEYNGEDKDYQVSSMMIFILSIAIAQVHHFFAKEYGLLIRGAISSKYTFINDNILLGEGISEAYLLESKIAVNPRVIFAEDIITDKILKKLSLNYSDNDLNIISKDCDGYYFVNYLSVLQEIPPMIGSKPIISKEILGKYKSLIDKGLSLGDTKTRCKYKWLKEYYSKVISHDKFELEK